MHILLATCAFIFNILTFAMEKDPFEGRSFPAIEINLRWLSDNFGLDLNSVKSDERIGNVQYKGSSQIHVKLQHKLQKVPKTQ